MVGATLAAKVNFFPALLGNSMCERCPRKDRARRGLVQQVDQVSSMKTGTHPVFNRLDKFCAYHHRASFVAGSLRISGRGSATFAGKEKGSLPTFLGRTNLEGDKFLVELPLEGALRHVRLGVAKMGFQFAIVLPQTCLELRGEYANHKRGESSHPWVLLDGFQRKFVHVGVPLGMGAPRGIHRRATLFLKALDVGIYSAARHSQSPSHHIIVVPPKVAPNERVQIGLFGGMVFRRHLISQRCRAF